MLSHALEGGVLVVTVHGPPGAEGPDRLAADISALVLAHRPMPVVVVLEASGTGGAAVDAVIQAHRFCASSGVLMSVVSHRAADRRLLEAGTATATCAPADGDAGAPAGGGHRMVVHARTDTAIAAAFAAAA
ncbi:hypothetical protein ACFWNK_12845 [Streptomyces sp. NPDC058417]|uniref:hypothetical protein n=1 Tax=unclassified Streptomyces TaxID=2593676 RepID=UPI003647460E